MQNTRRIFLLAGLPVFVGLIADSGITKVTVTNPSGQEDYVCVDNVSYGGEPISGLTEVQRPRIPPRLSTSIVSPTARCWGTTPA